jgi:hypothetical protein
LSPQRLAQRLIRPINSAAQRGRWEGAGRCWRRKEPAALSEAGAGWRDRCAEYLLQQMVQPHEPRLPRPDTPRHARLLSLRDGGTSPGCPRHHIEMKNVLYNKLCFHIISLPASRLLNETGMLIPRWRGDSSCSVKSLLLWNTVIYFTKLSSNCYEKSSIMAS